VPVVTSQFHFERDPDDEAYLNLAIEAEADFLISGDNDLLDLMISHSDEAKDFRHPFEISELSIR
jgi:predicted nucleic acid-binding protein